MKTVFGKLDVSELWKKYKFAILILLAGVLLMLLPTGGKERESKTEESRCETFSLEETERKMEEILGKIQGTGKLQVMLTLKSGSRLQLAEDTERDEGDGEYSSHRETVTVNRGSGYQDIIVTQQFYPLYQGAVVVCQGADNGTVRLAVTEAVAVLTGLSSDKITVIKWSS